jgi:hypothetical protein
MPQFANHGFILLTNWGPNSHITDISVMRLADGCPYLEELNLENGSAQESNITDRCIIRVAEKCPNLHM